MVNKLNEFLAFWFGPPGTADLPNSDRTNLWFGEYNATKEQQIESFRDLYEAAANAQLHEWASSASGRLGLIILYDQFSRFIYYSSSHAFDHDLPAQDLCLDGIKVGMDRSLTLIERVFFYMPLVHAEDSQLQEKSIRLYQELVALSMSETTQIYQLFLAYAYAHFRVIKEFGRFPQRNKVLNRESTHAELAFLKNT